MHLALFQRLLESHAHLLKPFTSFFDIINRDRDMTKALLDDVVCSGFDICIAGGVALKLGVRFSAMVVGKLKDGCREPKC